MARPIPSIQWASCFGLRLGKTSEEWDDAGERARRSVSSGGCRDTEACGRRRAERERERERLAARNGGSGFGRASSGCGGSLSRAASAFTWLLPGGSGLVGLEMTTSVSHANYSIKCSQGEEMKRRSAESLGNFSE